MTADSFALLLLGHGSTLNADSSTPTYVHAETIRARRLFRQVALGFWKEEPNFRQCLRQIDAPHIYVVPNFISSGYFTEQIIPRELELTGPVIKIGDQTLYQCEPVGLHEAMQEALVQRAKQVVAQSGVELPHPEKTACLFICGHGTNFNDNSTKIIYKRAAAIKALGLFADCQPVLMEQKPFVKDWHQLTDLPDVIVVPFFISDGLHSYEDIPVLLGLTPNIRERGFTNPNHFESTPSSPLPRRLWYASAIGTEPFLAEVILQQIEKFRSDHPELFLPPLKPLETVEEPFDSQQTRAFAEWLTLPGIKTLRQVQITGQKAPFELRHRDDSQTALEQLTTILSEAQMHKIVQFTEAGTFRPFHAAPTLKSGWVWSNLSLTQLRLALDVIYPAALANALLHKADDLPITHWRTTAERQTGRFKIVKDLDDAGATQVVREHCHVRCGKTQLWSPACSVSNPNAAISGVDNDLPFYCPEACNPFVGKAREALKGPEEEG